MPTYDGTPVLTIGKAEKAKRVAKAWFDEIGWGDAPAMYKPGHEGPMWVLSLEGGPEDWPLQICEALRDKWPSGVFAEPVNTWCLGLYPATDATVTSEGKRLVRDWEQAIATGRPGDEHTAGIALAQFVRDHHA
jgi:hypothetical protein